MPCATSLRCETFAGGGARLRYGSTVPPLQLQTVTIMLNPRKEALL